MRNKEDPEDEEDKDDEEEKEDEVIVEVEDGDDEVEDGTITVESDDDNTLPKTATSTFNWLLGGFMAIAAGAAGLFTRKQKRSSTK